jgi:murein hydrolase activator
MLISLLIRGPSPVIIFFLLAVFISQLCSDMPCVAQTSATPSREAVGSRIEEQKQHIRQVEQQESSALEKLDVIDRQLTREKQRLDDLADSLSALQKKIKFSQDHIDKLKKDRVNNEQALNRRLVSTYKFYKRGFFKILLSTPSYSSFLQQEFYLQHVLANDQKLFADSLRLIEAETASRNALVAQRSEIESLKESLARQSEVIEQAKKEKVMQLAAVRREKSLQVSALAELEKYAAEIQNLVDTIPSDRTEYLQKNQKFSSRLGRLSMPLKGRIVSRFGRKNYPGLQTTTFQKGIDIDCRSGLEVKSVYHGKVVYAGWFKGYGNTLIVDHGEGYYSLIAHASKLLKQVGDVVSEGESIALSGDTGSLSGSILHFEIRHHGRPQDPLPWFKRETT